MTYLLTLMAGAIQGLTEFLPVSSSAHLLLFHEFFKFNLADNLSFDAALHFGTLLALLLFFYRDIIDLIKGFFASFVKRDLKNDLQQRLPWMIIVGSIPAVLVGFFFNDLIDLYLHEGPNAILITAVMLLAVAVLFLVVEKYALKNKELSAFGFKQALLCGMAQAVALIPGTSRSGITIIASLGLGLKREAAARFSFLLSLPVVAGASAKMALKLLSGGELDWRLLLVGIVSAFVFGYLAIDLLLKYLNRHSLNIFAYYRIALAMVLLGWLYCR